MHKKITINDLRRAVRKAMRDANFHNEYYLPNESGCDSPDTVRAIQNAQYQATIDAIQKTLKQRGGR